MLNRPLRRLAPGLLALLLSGCGTAEAPSHEAPIAPAPPPPAAPTAAAPEATPVDEAAGDPTGGDPVAASDEPVVVWMEIAITADDGRALVEGRTSLPDETLLVVSVFGESDYDAQGIAVVHAGAFSAGPFGPEAGLAEGSYTARASMSLPQTQPASVQAIIGDGGQNLVGERVNKTDMGLEVAISEDFEVEAGSGLLSGEKARAEARSILEGLSAVEALGRSMDPLRVSIDPNAGPRCQGKMADGDEQLRALGRRTERLPSALRGPLTAAINDLKLCVQCEGTAMEMCTVAAASIQRGQTQVDSVSVMDLRVQ